MTLRPSFGNMKGHGQLGLRSNMRTFKDLLDQSGSHRDILAVVEPVLTVTGWTLSSGTIYVAPFEYTYRGVRRDVKSVSAIADPDLTRAETSALSSGEYYYEPNETFDQSVYKWDQSDGRWQLACWAFDGSTDYWLHTGSLDGISTGKEATLSFWFKCDANPAALAYMFHTNGGRFMAYLNTNGAVYVQAKNSGNSVIASSYSQPNLCDGVWHYIFFTCNLADEEALIYVDGTAKTTAIETDDTIDFTNGNHSIGAGIDGSGKFTGHLAQMWFIDDEVGTGASDSTVRGLFYDATNSRPVDLPVDGSVTVSGVTYTPLLYLFETVVGQNNGSAGNFVDQGSTIAAVDSPNQTPALKWDQFPQLYVNLTDDSNPGDTTIVAHLGFHFATRAQSHPTIGADIFSGEGDFETWAAGVPSGWADGGGDGTITEETSDVFSGSSCAKLSLVGDESDDYIFLTRTVSSPVNGGMYRLCGYYKTDITTGTSVAFIKVKDSSDALTVASDGRTVVNSLIGLDDTDGYWRFFSFDFIWDGSKLTNDMKIQLYLSQTDGVCDVYFDDVTLQRIWRYEFYEPRLTDSSIPTSSSGSNDVFFGGKRTSTGEIGFINHDKFFEVAGGQLEWINQRSTIFVGGRFLSDPVAASGDPYTEGQEILFNDMRQAYSGLVQRLKVSDSLTEVDMQDVRTYFHIKLPRRVYADTDFPNLYTTDWQGKVRPIFFGVKSNITPVRLDYEATYDKYGKYEICDCTDAPNGITVVDTVYAYTNETQADLRDSNSRLELTEDTHYTVDLALGRFTIDVDVGPYEIIAGENDAIDFTDGVGANIAWLTADLYTAAGLASHIQTQMDAESADAITCTYSDTTNKFTIASDGGTLELDIQDGPNKDRSAYKTLGFTDTANKTGATSYVGDDVTFTSADTDHVIRCNAQGYKDDASGTYTGTANSLIEIGADICKVLLIEFMDRPASIIDTTSFEDARERASETLAMYIKESISSKDIFEKLEYSNIANIVIDGQGVVHYEVYTGAVATNTTTIYDRDIMEFSVEKGYADIYQTIRVLYDEDPSTGEKRAREASDTSVSVRLGRQDIKEFETFLKYSDNATSVSSRMLELSKQAARRITLSVLGGSLIDHKVGDKVRIERDRALSASGALSGEAFRILSTVKDYLKGLVTIEVTDDKVTVASQACVTSCQLFCRIQCRLGCQLECQDFCKLNCEVGCEVGCQDLCESACQETCQLGCLQVACELSCQAGGCESVCQACEGAGCQTDCEVDCQTGCETSCQDFCRLNGCQTACQQGCQTGCEISCQTGCEISCQDVCQTGCQDPCETSCQATCMLTCRDDCQLGTCQFQDETDL